MDRVVEGQDKGGRYGMCAPPPNPVQSVPSKQHLKIVAGPVHARGD